jgi:dTDP-4-dehydrorhamnose 3,5-epimerase
VIDLRVGSPTYGEHGIFRLYSGNKRQLFIPKGCAHGFLAIEEHSIVICKTTAPHMKGHTSGIRFCGPPGQWIPEEEWLPQKQVALSNADRTLPTLAEYFANPIFQYNMC